MRIGTFGYHVAYLTGRPGEISSLIATLVKVGKPLRAMLWSVPKQRWIYAPAIAATLLYDDLEGEGTDPVDRVTAERVAREQLGTELPTEEQLLQTFQEAESREAS